VYGISSNMQKQILAKIAIFIKWNIFAVDLYPHER